MVNRFRLAPNKTTTVAQLARASRIDLFATGRNGARGEKLGTLKLDRMGGANFKPSKPKPLTVVRRPGVVR